MTELMTVQNTGIQQREAISADLFRRFIEYTDREPTTTKGYITCLRQFFTWITATGRTQPQRADIIAYKEYLEGATFGRTGAEPLKAGTKQQYLRAVKHFFKWTASEGLYPNIADNLKSGVKPSHSHKKDALSTEQCAELIQGVKAISKVKKLHNEEKELRDKAILSLMCTAGLRTIEVVRANVNDIRFERGKCFLFVQGKGHSDADEKILLAKQTQKAIQAYLKIRKPAASSEPLFVSTSRSNKGKRLDTQTIRKMVKARLREIGLDTPRLTAHSLRHSVCSNLVFAGVELPKIQMIARHKNLNTTLIYTHSFERYNNDGEQLLADLIFSQMKECLHARQDF